jgi:hydrogenase nickel incorporation protein HypB
MVQNALNGWDLRSLDFVFIENIGSLVYPSSYDFGKGLRFVLLAVTAGEDKPLTYPTRFKHADATIVTKSDLADAVECDGAAAGRNIQTVRPGMKVFRPSAKTGEGIKEFLGFLENWRTRFRAAAAV